MSTIMARRYLRAVLSAALLAAGVATTAAAGAPAAIADDCTGTWSIGIGGFMAGGGQDSGYMGVNQRVGYNTYDPASGVREIDRLFWSHRDQCPGDHIKIIGHSEGAAITHAWVTDNQSADNVNVVLLADPKMWSYGGSGMSRELGFLGWPVAGNDDWFGNVPVLSICRWNDHVCRADSDWGGYLNGAHNDYPMNAWDWGDWDSGVQYW